MNDDPHGSLVDADNFGSDILNISRCCGHLLERLWRVMAADGRGSLWWMKHVVGPQGSHNIFKIDSFCEIIGSKVKGTV
jgi:hypothetical protein